MKKIGTVGDYGPKIPKDLDVEVEVGGDISIPDVSSQHGTTKEVNFEGEGTKEMVTTVSFYQLIYSMASLFIGLFCIIGGIALFFNGITGNTSWTAEFLGAKSKISDAAPGVVLFIVGLFIIWVTKFNVRVKQPKRQ